MIRSCLLLAALACSNAFDPNASLADEPSDAVIAVSDWRAASWLAKLPPTTATEVLLQNDDEDYAIVNSRAIATKHATHVVYLGGDESLLSQMFRERLTMQGARPVDLRIMRPARTRLQAASHPRNEHVAFATLLNQP
jgi:hypothetical protein